MGSKADLEPFGTPVREWFRSSFEAPTPAQSKGWPAIATGEHYRTGRPCGRCASRIRSRRQGDLGRTTYWCPTCQPMQVSMSEPRPSGSSR